MALLARDDETAMTTTMTLTWHVPPVTMDGVCKCSSDVGEIEIGCRLRTTNE
jgi:hypothetical protein